MGSPRHAERKMADCIRPTLAGPGPTESPGMQFVGGSGGNGLDPRVTGIRVMDANWNQGARIVYMNQTGQTVNPFTGRTIGNANPLAHFYYTP